MRAPRSVCGPLLAAGVAGLGLRGVLLAFAPCGAPKAQLARAHASGVQPAVDGPGQPASGDERASPWDAAARLAAGAALSALLLVASVGPARADLEDTAIPIDGKGKTVNLTKEEIIRGKRLFNAACASCHVGFLKAGGEAGNCRGSMRALALLLAGVGGLGLRGAFLAFAPCPAPKAQVARARASGARPAAGGPGQLGEGDEHASPWDAAARLAAGAALSALLLVASAGPARADLEDTAIPIDGKGKTVNLTKEEIIRGKRLFNAACASCHVGGGTRTNQNVGLGFEELSGAQPARNTVEGLVDYLNAPTTYDGLKDISEVHPSIKAADIWPKMRTMKQKDLYDMSAYILYQNFTIPEKWGGGKQYY
eukprot:CAMPEP_0204611234 /NCGR_PEP_ID=MMETSP0661-20131031/61918_1 /ASSEMBLY_ACC=CAM_ASM_000606 /TAXON_ID=109239 /ORGANISM="Alexandrium margalefi, Strain AMGDE01CS-322" /LENGTH=367 /DNA_ID=CAMNT_0051623077 /DNA_START=55 /DNA_END=1158 /DNA_ORIENTATION=-